MPKIIVFGTSHAKRIHKAVSKHPEASQFEIVYVSAPNINVSSEEYQSNRNHFNSLTENDHVIVQYLGNDIFEKHIKVTHNPKTIHLTKFVPASDSILKTKFRILRSYLRTLPAKVTIIDHFYRYLNCCSKHVHPGIVKYQAARNKELKEYFSQFEVIDHRKTLGFRSRDLRDIKLYQGLFEDKVHLKPEGYAKIADFLYRHIFN
jgi:lysophospholipase L1-like esterase